MSYSVLVAVYRATQEVGGKKGFKQSVAVCKFYLMGTRMKHPVLFH